MTALYQTIANQLLSEFANGSRAARVALPSEADLQSVFGVSRKTIRRALEELQSAGIVSTQRGVGSFILADKINKPVSTRLHFRRKGNEQSTRSQMRVLCYSARKVTTVEEAHFDCKPDRLVGDLGRLLSFDGRPTILQRSILLLPNPENLSASLFESASLYEVLRSRFSIKIPMISKTIEAVTAPEDVARLLCIEPGAAIFRVRRIGLKPDSRVVELSTNYVRGDRFCFSYSGANEDFEQ